MNTLVSHMFHISINIGLVYNRLTLPTLHIIDSEHFSHTHVSYKYKYRPSIQSFNPTYTTHYR